jgi:nucleoside-diphosphate-sugar epimerase
VTIVTRSATKAEQFRSQGYQALVADITRPETLWELAGAELILFSVGFDRSASSTIHQVYADSMRHVLSRLPTSATTRLIYISTTGVYGPREGSGIQEAWVDEHQPTQPQRAGAQASLAAEQQLADHPLGKHAVILRMAGLYGPGRIPYLEKIRAGQPLAVPQKGWLNLIHVDDGASTVVAAGGWSAAISQGPELFNVTDGRPVVRGDYYREVAQRIGAPAPRFTTPDANLPATVRAETSKRISNEKLLNTLSIKLAYPSYREGLADALGPSSLTP